MCSYDPTQANQNARAALFSVSYGNKSMAYGISISSNVTVHEKRYNKWAETKIEFTALFNSTGDRVYIAKI